MKIFTAILLLLCYQHIARAQNVRGLVTDSLTNAPIHGATVVLNPGHHVALSDENGRFFFSQKHRPGNYLTLTMVGYEKKLISTQGTESEHKCSLKPKTSELQDVVISSGTVNPFRTISESDIKMRGISNSQEALRIVPGLFIGQHQGGGKAEQIFLRGFDNDHGTNINLSVDGMPINLVSHAHGQGYADSHFIIPEIIGSTVYQKGMYSAEKGDLAVTGFVNFNTVDQVCSMIRAEAGQFDTYRLLAMADLLGKKGRDRQASWYIAAEYRFSNSYFDNPQRFKRFNVFTKYSGRLNENNWLRISLSDMQSGWKASGQLPLDAVERGEVGFFGAIDPNEGGATSRSNMNAELRTTLSDRSVMRNQVYYSHYTFDLHSNFTYFLEDIINGDEIRQQEHRNLVGYNGSLMNESYIGNLRLTTHAGINFRLDATKGTSLLHTMNNTTVIDSLKFGNITETGAGAYFSETLRFNGHFTLDAGLRFDKLFYQYKNRLAADSTFSGVGYYTASNAVLSPKIKFSYQLKPALQFYVLGGKGFHSNDARVAVAQKGNATLPAAYGADLGLIAKPVGNLLVNAAVWTSYLQKEFVYGGDGGTVEFSGNTKRMGADLSVRYQPVRTCYLDFDLNYAHGRATGLPAGEDRIPLAPVWTSAGGITYLGRTGINGSLRYRWMGQRPANEDNSLTASGYFVNDLLLNYTRKKFEAGISINNLFNVRWRETQYASETRLKGGQPDNGITFTPGTKFFGVVHFTVFL